MIGFVAHPTTPSPLELPCTHKYFFLDLRMIQINYEGCFGDKRIDKRGAELHRGLFRNSVHSIQQIAEHRAEQKGYYRFLRNDKVSESKLVNELSERCGKLCEGRIVLSIQDTTQINLRQHSKRISKNNGIGDITDSKGIGFFMHPSLVVDAMTCTPIGLSDIHIWNRPFDMPSKEDRRYESLPIEDKESYKWIESSERTKKALKAATSVIIVQDREGDIFDQFTRVPDEKTFLLIRSSTNRTTDSNQKLWDRLGSSALLGSYELPISADSRRKTVARTAIIEVRGVQVDIKRPKNSSRGEVNVVSMYAIEAKEVNSMVEEPVHWRLITTWPVNSFDDCARVIDWYTWRWQIEELFRVLKEEGYNIEGSELESALAIRKLAIMMMDVIIKLMQMRIAYDRPEDEQQIETVFDEQEQECLIQISKRMEGKTQKLSNSNNPKNLKWATWVIARMGGWKGYASQRPPGLTALRQGLEQFYNTLIGWNLQKDVGTR